LVSPLLDYTAACSLYADFEWTAPVVGTPPIYYALFVAGIMLADSLDSTGYDGGWYYNTDTTTWAVSWYVIAYNEFGAETSLVYDFFIERCPDDIERSYIKPDAASLSASPNPFNSSCRISTPAEAKVEILDLNGKRIAQLPSGMSVWTPEKRAGTGMYILKAKAKDGQIVTKRILYLK